MADVWFVIVLYFLSLLGDFAQANVPTLTSTNFQDRIIGSPHFVMFYGPWCEHCKNMMTAWEGLSTEYEAKAKMVNIAKVDCTAETSLCAEHNIRAYPTLKLYHEGAIKRYDGKRNVAEFTKFVNKLVFKESTNEEPSSSEATSVNGVNIFTKDNFDQQIEMGLHFVKFYAPWCIHCIKLAPIWEALAQKYKGSSEITISKIDCTVHGTKCSELNVKAFPSLKLFKDGKEVDQYTSGRTLKDLDQFVFSSIAQHLPPSIYTSTTEPSQPAVQEETSPPLPAAEKNDNEDDLIKPYQLNENNFDAMVSMGTTFIKFYAPWCVHCKNLAPIWEKLAKKCAETAAGPKIARIDCTAEEQLCQTFGVTGYPTLTLFKDGHPKQEFTGNRDLESLYKFVMQNHDKDEL